jgi:hypothetical protein
LTTVVAELFFTTAWTGSESSSGAEPAFFSMHLR